MGTECHEVECEVCHVKTNEYWTIKRNGENFCEDCYLSIDWNIEEELKSYYRSSISHL